MAFVHEWQPRPAVKYLALAEQRVVNGSPSNRIMSNSFPKQTRILNSSVYSSVLRRPQKKLVTGPVQVKACDNGLEFARLGLVVPKRGTARAYDRNQIKRIIREEFRLTRNSLPPKDMIVQVFSKVSAEQLRGILGRQFAALSAGCV
jgi:ribonuclease P protein component